MPSSLNLGNRRKCIHIPALSRCSLSLRISVASLCRFLGPIVLRNRWSREERRTKRHSRRAEGNRECGDPKCGFPALHNIPRNIIQRLCIYLSFKSPFLCSPRLHCYHLPQQFADQPRYPCAVSGTVSVAEMTNSDAAAALDAKMAPSA